MLTAYVLFKPLTFSIPVIFSIIMVEDSVDPDQKPSDLNLQCFQKKINPCSADQGLIIHVSAKCAYIDDIMIYTVCHR